MKVMVNKAADVCIMQVEGRIDTNTAEEFEQALMENLEKEDALRIDMEAVAYISSAGLRAFLNGQKLANKGQKRMSLANVSQTIMEVFDMTGFADILTFEV